MVEWDGRPGTEGRAVQRRQGSVGWQRGMVAWDGWRGRRKADGRDEAEVLKSGRPGRRKILQICSFVAGKKHETVIENDVLAPSARS
jgi:hypothetical protein